MLTDNDVLVVNETKVINARLKGYIGDSQKSCEIFLHKQLTDTTWDCLVYPGRKLKVGTKVVFYDVTHTKSQLNSSPQEDNETQRAGKIISPLSLEEKGLRSVVLCAEIKEVSEK